jgi:hypothetical protein
LSTWKNRVDATRVHFFLALPGLTENVTEVSPEDMPFPKVVDDDHFHDAHASKIPFLRDPGSSLRKMLFYRRILSKTMTTNRPIVHRTDKSIFSNNRWSLSAYPAHHRWRWKEMTTNRPIIHRADKIISNNNNSYEHIQPIVDDRRRRSSTVRSSIERAIIIIFTIIGIIITKTIGILMMKINLKRFPNKQRAVPTYQPHLKTNHCQKRKEKWKKKDKKHKCTHKN